MDKFFAAFVAILDEALAAHELLPSQVKAFEMSDMPSGGVWVDLDEEYYTWVVLLPSGELSYSVNGRFSEASESERLPALNEQKAQEDGQDAEFYNLMAEAQ